MTGVLARYEELLDAGELREDADQHAAAVELDRLQSALESGGDKPSGLLAKLRGRKAEPVRGIYMWGGVGRGKSMLMDLFYECLDIEKKRRVHFHALKSMR